MTVPQLIARSRAAARRLMLDRCTVTRGTYPDLTDVETGLPCRVKSSSARASREVEVASGETVVLPTYEVRVPYDADLARGDVITVTSSQDPQFDGRWLTVVDVLAETTTGSRVVLCREQQS